MDSFEPQRKDETRLYILGVDTGYRSYGLARVQIYPELEVKNWITLLRPKGKDDEDKATEAILETGGEMATLVNQWITSVFDSPPVAIAAEGISIPKKGGPSVSLKLGVGWGIIISHAARFGVPIFQRFPVTLKQHIAGKKTASKKELQDALELNWKVDFGDTPATHREHGADAIAVAITVAQTEKMVRATLNAFTSRVP